MRWARTRRLPDSVAVGETLVEARGIRVAFGRATILSGVDLTVAAGEVVALVGPNGAGKSTLFSVLAGDLQPAAGSVLLGGRPLRSWSPGEAALRRAVLPQQVTVAFPFLVEDVVRMGRAPWARTAESRRDDDCVAAALAEAEVSVIAGREFPSLSGGEAARVAFARVLAQHTRLLLLDEPTAALDLHHQEALLGTLRAKAANGHGVLVVLHDLGLAAAYADRVAIVANGTIAANGPPAEVLTAATLSEVYQHDVEVFTHPASGALVVQPRRAIGQVR